MNTVSLLAGFENSITRVILGENGVEGYELIEEDEYGNFIDPQSLIGVVPFVGMIAKFEKYWKTKCTCPNTSASIPEKFDTRKFVFKYENFDIKTASTRPNKAQGKIDRSVFLDRPEINIFPDTLVWTSDYTYSYNDPWSEKLFPPSFL